MVTLEQVCSVTRLRLVDLPIANMSCISKAGICHANVVPSINPETGLLAFIDLSLIKQNTPFAKRTGLTGENAS